MRETSRRTGRNSTVSESQLSALGGLLPPDAKLESVVVEPDGNAVLLHRRGEPPVRIARDGTVILDAASPRR